MSSSNDCRTKLTSRLLIISGLVLLTIAIIIIIPVVVVLVIVPQSNRSDNTKTLEINATEIYNFTKLKSNRHLVRSHGRLDDDEDDDFALNPLEINVDTIYTPWTKWSRCKKKCKQVRKRFCKLSSICGSNILKEERPCDRGRCHRRRKKDNFHIVRKKKLSQRTRGVLKFNRAFLTRWSRWSPCSEACKTIRSRRCLFSLVCGFSVINEEAYCYTDGSTCEKWYKEGTYPRPGPFGPLTDNETDPEIITNHEQVETTDREENQSDSEKQCGIQHIESEQQTPPWALRIIGGREAARGRWSWQVAILNKYREVFCGGTLVAPGWVLTAAHCIRKHMFVRLGEHDLIVKEGTEIEYSVLNVIQHPDYNADTVDNDIALIRIPVGNEDESSVESGSIFDTDMDVTRNGRKIQNYAKGRGKSSRKNKKPQFSTACLPDQNELLPEYDSAHCTIVGWGKEKNTHAYGTEVLHEAEIPIVSEKECLNVYRDYYISKNMFCAGYKGGRVDSCAGDSGGPLLCQNQQGYWTIYGITSFGEGCGQRYGIYSKVPNYTSWIRGVIKSNQ